MTSQPAAPVLAPTQTPPKEVIASSLALLDAFHHRNRNQHHVAAWWARFDHLRRSLRKLHHDFGAGAGASAARRKAGGLDRRLAARAADLTRRSIPPAYVAFTQLAADPAFAPFGLFLLGVLARLSSTLSVIATPAAPAPAPTAPGSQLSANNASSGTVLDRGVAISRDAVPDPLAPLASSQPTLLAVSLPPAAPASLPVPTSSSAPSGKKKKRPKKRDEFAGIFAGLN